MRIRKAPISGITGQDVIDPNLYRPAEIHLLIGNATRAEVKFGWQETTGFEALVREMVATDCPRLGMECPLSAAAKV